MIGLALKRSTRPGGSFCGPGRDRISGAGLVRLQDIPADPAASLAGDVVTSRPPLDLAGRISIETWIHLAELATAIADQVVGLAAELAARPVGYADQVADLAE